jgi:HPt (histidine-containing phosphotransfer) domain-containing protein
MKLKKIDINVALAQLGGSKKLYKTLLLGFNSKYSEVDKDILSLAINNNMEDARRLSHSIKGLSGNLGASKLREYAFGLEKAFRDGDTYEDLYNIFSKELKEVVSEVEIVLKSMEEDIDSSYVNGLNENAGDDFICVCNELLDALHTFKFVQVNKIYSKFKNLTYPRKYENEIFKLKRNIEDYNYTAAAEEMKKIIDL